MCGGGAEAGMTGRIHKVIAAKPLPDKHSSTAHVKRHFRSALLMSPGPHIVHITQLAATGSSEQLDMDPW